MGRLPSASRESRASDESAPDSDISMPLGKNDSSPSYGQAAA